jgi:hypothetical protein
VTSARLACLLVLAWALVLFSSPAHAQGTATLKTQVSSRRVEAGESFTVTLSAMTDKGSTLPQSPSLPVPAGIAVQGPAIGMQQQVTLQGGGFQQRFGISATWTLKADKPGRYRLGPPSVLIGAQRATGDPVEVQVVAAGSAPRGRHRDPLDPFGFGLPAFPSILGDDEPESLPAFPEELRVGAAEEPVAFLRAVASPMRAVVGQQVTLRIYAYGGRGPFRESNTAEPSREAFLAHTLLENSYAETMHRVPIGDEIWHAKKVRELALFPIRTGRLTIGAMRMGFEGRGYPSAGPHKGLVRMSTPLAIEVSEPPAAGRPPGYKPGDVGRFALTASVEPRQISAGEAVSVVAKLEGTGNLPPALRTPQQTGVTWLEPTITEDIAPRGSRVGGWRKLTFVVRMDTAGDVDLGELTLPYWDPERESYDLAKAALGTVKVLPGSAPPAGSKDDDELAGALPLRKALGSAPTARWTPTDAPWFWPALLFAPLGVVVLGASRRVGRRLAAKLSTERQSPSSRAARALAEARAALSAGDGGAAASQSESAVLIAVEGATGLRARAVLKQELTGELRERGLKEALARDVVSLLEACDDLRFTGESDAGAAGALVERAAKIVKALGRAA